MNNKARTDSYIPFAIDALKLSGIADKNEKINSSYRGQISSFGAAVAVGSFKQAVAFFAQDAKDKQDEKNSKDKINRSKLISAIEYVVNRGNVQIKDPKAISEEILKKTTDELRQLENQYMDAAVALKVAMSIYDMKSDKEE